MKLKEIEILEDSLKEAYEMNSNLACKIQEVEFQNKNLIEMLTWIKEAFGENINEDYGHWKLSSYIDDKFKEENITIPVTQ